MHKKGQIIGQVFIYIMAAIIIGAIILLGYWAISTINEKVCQAEQITFKSKIETYLSKHSTYGSVNKETLIAPCNYQTLCFIDASQIGNVQGVLQCKNKVIDAAVKDGDMKNIYLSNGKTTIPIGYSKYVSVENVQNCTCIDARSKNFFITFKGFNSRTVLLDTMGVSG